MGIFESLLIDTFTVERRDRFPDGQGGWIISSLLGTMNNDYYNLGMRRFTLELAR